MNRFHKPSSHKMVYGVKMFMLVRTPDAACVASALSKQLSSQVPELTHETCRATFSILEHPLYFSGRPGAWVRQFATRRPSALPHGIHSSLTE